MRKGSFLQDGKGIPAMAGLLLFALCCTPLLGCIIPQDEQLLGELPPKRNSPLKIIPGGEVPVQRTTYFNGNACSTANLPFKLKVQDEDLGDVVSSMWFIGKTTNEPFRPSAIPGGSKVRSVTAPSSLGFKSALANLPAGSTEVLVVYVADTLFEEPVGGVINLQPRAPTTLPDGSQVVDEGSYDTFTWVLDVERGEPCP